jgi:hypothetical protein
MWNQDYTRLTIGDATIELKDLPTFYSGLMDEANILFEQLTQGHTVQTPPPEVMSDNMEIQTPEYSFMDSCKRWMQEERFHGINTQARAPGWIIYNDDIDGPQWNKKLMLSFMLEAEQLLHCLMVLVHISNQPARATELFTMQFRNSQSTNRSFFASDWNICWILGYSKVCH